MKKVINVGIGGRSFVLDEDACARLNRYLEQFKVKMGMGGLTKEVMDDLEIRIAELFSEQLGSFKNVVDLRMVNNVIEQLGMPDGEPFVDPDVSGEKGTAGTKSFGNGEFASKPAKRLYRNPDNKTLGGVCSGLAVYLGIDTVLIRVCFIIAFFLGSAGFWVYVVLWLAAPLAETPIQKCEMYGLPVTAENISKFSRNK